MVNRSANINKTNNHLSPKSLNLKRTQHVKWEIHVLVWDMMKNVSGLKPIIGPPLLDNWNINDNVDKQTIKNLHRFGDCSLC